MSDLVIETSSFTKRFGTVLAVDVVNLQVAKGEIYGFLGLNGVGKTTTICTLGWTIFTVVLAQVAALTGWEDWFP